MKKLKTYSLWLSLCLCILYVSAAVLATSPYAHEKVSAEQELLISDASSLGHLEEIISENLFTPPSPFRETTERPTVPHFVKVRLSIEKGLLTNELKWCKRPPTNIPSSQHISDQFEYSSQYYVFALHHIII